MGHHRADLTACTEALIERTLLGRRLARIGGGEVLAQNQVARLCVLASLHNFGQFSIAFQNKRLDRPPFPTRGHPREALGLLNDGYRFADRAWECLALEEIATWGEDMDGLFHATILHHGRPVRREATCDPSGGRRPVSWIPSRASRNRETRCWFPTAWEAGGERLPTRPEFHHAWAGLLKLADRSGSDSERCFPFSIDSGGDRGLRSPGCGPVKSS